MAVYGSDKVAFLLIDGYSVLGTRTEISDSVEALTEETHALGDSWVEHSPTGLKRGSIEHNGFFDDAANSINAALVSQEGVSRVLCYGVADNVIGRKFIGFRGAMQINYVRLASRGALHRANASYQNNGAVDEGVILHALGAETGTSGNTEASSVDNSASSANGGQAYAQVSALTLGGYTNCTLKVRHSADNVTFADLTTFTVVSAAPVANSKAVTGTVNRYLASSYAFSGAGSGQSITYLIGFSRA